MANRQWCFTLQADEDKGEHLEWPRCLPVQQGDPRLPVDWRSAPHFRYMHYQVERAPETGKLHLQGFICFDDKMRLSALKKISNRAHWEASRGTFEQNVAYCSKAASRVCGPFVLGEPPKQGKRTDLKLIKELVEANKTDREINDATEGASLRFEKQIKYCRFLNNEQRSDRQLQGVRVIVLWGPTGTGKTYSAINYIAGNSDYYIAECPSNANSKLWFDGYEGQRTLILDDYCADFCQYRFLLRLLDKYKLKVEYKGGHTWACWTTVVITANNHPKQWYPCINTDPLRRRITEIRKVTEQGLYCTCEWDDPNKVSDSLPFVPPCPPPPPPSPQPDPQPEPQQPQPQRAATPPIPDFTPSPASQPFMVDSEGEEYVPPTARPSQQGRADGRTCSPTQIIVLDSDSESDFDIDRDALFDDE